MKLRLFSLALTVIFITACRQDYTTTKIEGKRISINDSLASNPEIEAYIKPYRESVNKDLDSTLAYSKATYSKNDGELNTSIGNFMADAVKEMGDPIFYNRTGQHIDLVLLNHGGIRSIISKGNISSRTAYDIMPFDNLLVVTPMNGKQVLSMLNFLSKGKRAHPISGLQLILNNDYSIAEASINGLPIKQEKIYYLATSDYLYNGGDRMSFLKSKDTVYNLDYKIRNLFIDYFKKIDTLKPQIDDRFIKRKN